VSRYAATAGYYLYRPVTGERGWTLRENPADQNSGGERGRARASGAKCRDGADGAGGGGGDGRQHRKERRAVHVLGARCPSVGYDGTSAGDGGDGSRATRRRTPGGGRGRRDVR